MTPNVLFTDLTPLALIFVSGVKDWGFLNTTYVLFIYLIFVGGELSRYSLSPGMSSRVDSGLPSPYKTLPQLLCPLKRPEGLMYLVPKPYFLVRSGRMSYFSRRVLLRLTTTYDGSTLNPEWDFKTTYLG